jgi:subtilase family serine protease
MPGVLTVSGVDRNGGASFDASSQGITIGVAAPSEELVGVVPGGGYVTWSGTSGASPIVAGIVALVRAAHPELDAANVINRVVSTARDVGDAGADYTYGYGLVDAAAAVTADVAPVSENPVGDLQEWIRVHRRADTTSAPGIIVPPIAVPQVVEGPANPIGTLLPSVTTLQLVGIPTLVVLLMLAVLTGLAVAAIREFGGRRRTR